MSQVGPVIRRYQRVRQLSDKQLIQALLEKIPDETISTRSMTYWKVGERRPSTAFLVQVLMKYKDWRFDFALDCLAIKHPDVYGSPDYQKFMVQLRDGA